MFNFEYKIKFFIDCIIKFHNRIKKIFKKTYFSCIYIINIKIYKISCSIYIITSKLKVYLLFIKMYKWKN